MDADEWLDAIFQFKHHEILKLSYPPASQEDENIASIPMKDARPLRCYGLVHSFMQRKKSKHSGAIVKISPSCMPCKVKLYILYKLTVPWFHRFLNIHLLENVARGKRQRMSSMSKTVREIAIIPVNWVFRSFYMHSKREWDQAILHHIVCRLYGSKKLSN